MDFIRRVFTSRDAAVTVTTEGKAVDNPATLLNDPNVENFVRKLGESLRRDAGLQGRDAVSAPARRV